MGIGTQALFPVGSLLQGSLSLDLSAFRGGIDGFHLGGHSRSSVVATFGSAMVDSLVFWAIKKLKIARLIVGLHLVAVMHYFARREPAAQLDLHHKAIFSNIAVWHRVRVIWRSHKDVSLLGCGPSSLPSGILAAGEAPLQRRRLLPLHLFRERATFWPRHENLHFYGAPAYMNTGLGEA